MSSTSGALPRTWFLQFDVSRWRYAGMAFGISFLNLLTIGVYKPYGLTRIRKALYDNIYIGKFALTYTGTARTLSRKSFYPSLALLFLLIVPGLLSFALDWIGIAVISVQQLLMLVAYAEYLKFLSLRYELEQTSWRGLTFTVGGSPWHYMQTSLLFQLGNLLTLGLLAPWRRVGLARITHGDLLLGRFPVGANFSVKPLLLTYLPGWALSLVGFAYGSWYYWKNAIIPLQTVLNGGAADPAMGAQLDPSLFSGGMAGAASGDTVAQIGTFFNVLNLFFIVFPLWQAWRIICLSPYEAAWWKHFFSAFTVVGASPRFEGNWLGLCGRGVISFCCNFFTCNLSRPFTTYARIRYFVTHTVITGADSLEASLRAGARPVAI